MPSKLVRIVLDLTSNNFIVEYGERRIPGLTKAQQKELDHLNEELIGYSDFTAAENLDSEKRQQLMEKKRRLTELAEKEVLEHFEWYPVEQHLIESLLIVVSPNQLHVYVENLPPNLMEKILEPQITLNFGMGQEPAPVPSVTEEQPIPPQDNLGILKNRTPKELRVIGVIAQDTPEWIDFVTVKEEQPDMIFVRPHRFLKDDWAPINRALRAAFGPDCWKSEGKGDSEAHWRIEVR